MSSEIAVYDNARQIVPFAAPSISDMEVMARYIVNSGLFGIQKVDQAVGLMLLCQSEGIDPIQAVRRYHIIQGRPAMRADAMLAAYQARGGRVEWITRTDTHCEAVFSHPSSGDVPVEWTIEMAKRAGLSGKQESNWSKYPRQMLTARVISEGVRTSLPAVVSGIYTPEEVADFEPDTKPKYAPRPKDYQAVPIERAVVQDIPGDSDFTGDETPQLSPRELFDAEAKRLGLEIAGAAERGLWMNRALGRSDDSRERITVADLYQATANLSDTVARIERESMAAAQKAFISHAYKHGHPVLVDKKPAWSVVTTLFSDITGLDAKTASVSEWEEATGEIPDIRSTPAPPVAATPSVPAPTGTFKNAVPEPTITDLPKTTEGQDSLDGFEDPFETPKTTTNTNAIVGGL